MQTTSTENSVKTRRPIIDILGVCFLEFLLPGNLYHYTSAYDEICSNNQVTAVQGLCFPIIAFSVWTITDSWSRRLGKYLLNLRYEKQAAVFITFLISFGKLLTLFIKNKAFKHFIQGCIAGFGISLLLALAKLLTTFPKEDPKHYTTLRHVARAVSFLILPHLFKLQIWSFGLFSAELLNCGILLNTIPIFLILINNFKREEDKKFLVKLRDLPNSLYYNSVNRDYKDDFWEEESDDDDDEINNEPQSGRYLNNDGVEILSVIEEESESIYTVYSPINSHNDLQDKDSDGILRKQQHLYIIYAFIYLLAILTKKVISIFIFAIFMTVFPYKTRNPLILLLTSTSWIVTAIFLTSIATSKSTKIGSFLFGLLISAYAFYILSPVKMEAPELHSVIYGFVFGVVTHTENIHNEILTLKRGVMKGIKILSGAIAMVMFLFLYVYFSTKISGLCLLFSVVAIINFVVWSVLIVIKHLLL